VPQAARGTVVRVQALHGVLTDETTTQGSVWVPASLVQRETSSSKCFPPEARYRRTINNSDIPAINRIFLMLPLPLLLSFFELGQHLLCLSEANRQRQLLFHYTVNVLVQLWRCIAGQFFSPLLF
jgi:hypothetical protein